jgi:tRNA (cmo5U34)-methyltransferase
MSTSPSKVKTQFDTLSASYDENRAVLIPAMETFYAAGIDVLFCESETPRVLDIGAGTGIYTGFLLKRYPQAQVTLIDFAENMLAIARHKFAGNDDMRYISDNYVTHDFGSEQYDIIISALSIHHLNSAEQQSLYRKLYGLLSAGGELLNADIVKSETDCVNKKFDTLWNSFVQKNLGENDELFARFLKSKAIDTPSTVSEQLRWLREAGFSVTDCVFKYNNFGVLYGQR